MEFLETAVDMIILKTYFYLEETGRRNSFDRFPYLQYLTEGVSEQALDAWVSDTGIQAIRYRGLLRELGDIGGDHTACSSVHTACSSVVQNALDLCLAAAYVPEFAAYLNYYTGNTVTVQLAFELERIFCPPYADLLRTVRQLQKICRIEQSKIPLWYAAIEADNGLLAYLLGADRPDMEPFGTVKWFQWDEELLPMFIRGEMAEECAEYLQMGGGVLQIAGRGGRRFLAKHIARLMHKDLLLADAGEWKEMPADERARHQELWRRQAFLWKGIVCIYGITADTVKDIFGSEEFFAESIIRPFRDEEVPVILCMSSEVRLTGDAAVFSREPAAVCRRELGVITRTEREAVFRGFAGYYNLSIDPVRCSVRYRLTASEIGRAVELLRSGAQNGDVQAQMGEEERFSMICYQILSDSQKQRLGNVLRPSVGFSDLKVPPGVMERLEEICCSARESYRIFEQWNLGRQYPYGRAVTVLLAGAPGTGKTMTAHVIAKELGIPLYQVNLSNVMDKYIGETEKHLEQVFSFAEKTNMVLFFDEADSLFGKRGEVTEGKDRYANMEVSYILQRIEQFEGIVVLATNFYNNIDRAFLRRMKYVLKYQEPDEKIRREIWESCLPPELPREELDLDYLAEQFDLTGGMIKNVILNACVTALREQSVLGMRQVLLAIRTECEKMERSLGEEVWGEYGYLL